MRRYFDDGARERQLRIQRVAEAAARKSTDPTRHRCFVSYHIDDDAEVTQFVDTFGYVFIPTVVGVTEDDDFVESDDTDYILRRIREEYLSSTTVTIVLVGRCTWARRFVDWEVYASLRRYTDYAPSALLAINLPSVANDSGRQLPARVNDNVRNTDEGYARWWTYPSSGEQLRTCIDIAFDARTYHTDLIDNRRARKVNSSPG